MIDEEGTRHVLGLFFFECMVLFAIVAAICPVQLV